jgi:hypothetical protein
MVEAAFEPSALAVVASRRLRPTRWSTTSRR